MTIVLPAQLYGKDCGNLYDWLIRSCEMKDKPVNEAVTFGWKAGNGEYPPVWALWVEPGQSWGLLYCFEDVGEEPGGSHRPHTLRKTVGLCTRADLPLISSLASGRQPQKHEVSDAGRWTLDFSAVEPPPTELWQSGILLKDDSANCSLRIKKLSTPAPYSPVNFPTEKTCPRKGDKRWWLFLIGFLIGLLPGSVSMYYVDRYIQNDQISKIKDTYQNGIGKLKEENANLKDQVKGLEKQVKDLKDQGMPPKDQDLREAGILRSVRERIPNWHPSAGGAYAADERP